MSRDQRFPMSYKGEYTSEAAAAEVQERAATLRKQVWNLALERGSLTPWEAISALRLPNEMIYIVRPRFTELYLEGRLEKLDLTRRGGPYGKAERVWCPLQGGNNDILRSINGTATTLP